MLNYKDKDPLRAAQLVMTDMLLKVHEICEKHDIPYWLCDGTLLGTVRHGGFIPWDDDADIGLLREDYNRLMEVLEKELPPPYKVQSIKYNTHGLQNWCKVIFADDFEWVDWHGNWTKGITIDIFPYDYVNDNEQFTFIQKFINRLATIRYPLEGKTVKQKLQRVINQMKLHQVYNRYNKETNTITYGIETEYYGYCFLDIDDIFPLTTGIFEGHEFKIPGNAHNYLSTVYDEEYMKIPEEDKRVSHMKNLRFASDRPAKEDD